MMAWAPTACACTANASTLKAQEVPLTMSLLVDQSYSSVADPPPNRMMVVPIWVRLSSDVALGNVLSQKGVLVPNWRLSTTRTDFVASTVTDTWASAVTMHSATTIRDARRLISCLLYTS